MKIRKTTLKLVILNDARDPNPRNMELEDIVEAIDTGPLIGKLSFSDESLLTTKKQITKQLKAMGNDGKFFDLLEEDDGPSQADYVVGDIVDPPDGTDIPEDY